MRVDVVSCVVSGLVPCLTALIAVWSQPGVANFSDVTPVCYGVIAVGGVLSGLKDLRSRRALPSANGAGDF